MKTRILFLAAALTLAALPVRAQTELQKLVAAAFEAEAKAWDAQGNELLAQNSRKDGGVLFFKSKNMALFAERKASLVRRRGRGKAAEAAFETAAQAWEAVVAEVAERERVRKEEAAERERVRKAEVAERERETAERRRQTRPVVKAYEAEERAWEAEADFDFVFWDGWNEDKKAKAADARINASIAQDGLSFAQRAASNANLHILRARENASDWRRTAGRETGGLKELANKAAAAWESAAQAWEAVGK